jgi:hypothetical protein
MMLLFVLGAAVSFAGFSVNDFRKYLPFWLPAIIAFALSVGREPSIMFLVLFLVPTICLGISAIFRRISPLPFLVIAISDVGLAIALSIYQSKSALWSLPPVGGWGFAAGFAGAAALPRLIAPATAGDRAEGGLLSLGWWQGALLVYWAGGPAGAVLVSGGVLIWALAAAFPLSRLGGLTLAGGTLAIAGGLGAGLPGILVIALSGIALALGERVVSSWTLALLPLSLLTAGVTLPTGVYMALPAAIFPAAWAAMSKRLSTLKTAEDQMILLPGLAGGGAAVYLAAVGWSFAPGAGTESGLPLIGEIETGIWLLYGVALAAGATFALTGSPVSIAEVEREAGRQYSQFHVLLPGLIPPVAWLVVGVSVMLTVRLVLAGLRTGFL